jgi:hypothetical protein
VTLLFQNEIAWLTGKVSHSILKQLPLARALVGSSAAKTDGLRGGVERSLLTGG